MSRCSARRQPAIVLLLACLAACDGIGEGSHPTGVRVVTESGAPGPLNVLECGFLELFAMARWEGDDAYEGNVSAVSTWESSNPAVIELGNGIDRSPNVVVARSAGVARVRVLYQGFTASMLVTVVPILEHRIMPETGHLAPGSTEDFRLEVRQDADDPWSPRGAQWLIPQVGAAGTVDADGVVRALSGPEDVPFTVEARLPFCGVTATRELRVTPVARLVLEYEQAPAQALPRGLTALIRVLAEFVDGSIEPQNLSGQAEISLERTDDDAVALSTRDEGIALQGLVDDKDAQLSVRYAPLHLTVLSERYRIADLDPTGLRLDPVQLDMRYPDEAQLQALATFSDGVERIVTRDVAWSISDDAVGNVTSAMFDAGRLTITQDVDQDVQVEAFTTINDVQVSAEADVRISSSR